MMTYREMICNAGVSTLREFLCLEKGDGDCVGVAIYKSLKIVADKKQHAIKHEKKMYNIKMAIKDKKVVIEKRDETIKRLSSKVVTTRK